MGETILMHMDPHDPLKGPHEYPCLRKPEIAGGDQDSSRSSGQCAVPRLAANMDGSQKRCSLRSLQRGCKDPLQGQVFYECLAGSTRVYSEMTSRFRPCVWECNFDGKNRDLGFRAVLGITLRLQVLNVKASVHVQS